MGRRGDLPLNIEGCDSRVDIASARFVIDLIMARHKRDKTTIGWREWVAMPELGLDAIKAKVDTGARTSAIHAFSVIPFEQEGTAYVRFRVHPLQRRDDIEVECVAKVVDQRMVTDSGGHVEERFVIEAPIQLANEQWPVEITLTNRDTMGFRMLLGRTAIRGRFIVDPAKSYMVSEPPPQAIEVDEAD